MRPVYKVYCNNLYDLMSPQKLETLLYMILVMVTNEAESVRDVSMYSMQRKDSKETAAEQVAWTCTHVASSLKLNEE